MTTSPASPTSTGTITDMELVEYTFARWVYIDKCYYFVDAYGNPAPNIKTVVSTLGSEVACIRALILHGHMAGGRQTRHARDPSRVGTNRSRGPSPLEAFKEALRIGLAAAEDPIAIMPLDTPTRPWERMSQSLSWLPVSRPDLPVFIPRPLSASTWDTVNPSGSTVSGTELIRTPRQLSTLHDNPGGCADEDLSAVWRCREADILYRNGECTVYPRLPEMKPFVVTGLPAVHSHVLYHPQPDPKAGPLHTTARPTSSKDVKDTPTLLIWSCVHGDLFVQAPKQVPLLPPISSFGFVFSPIPSSSSSNLRDRPSPTSLKRYTPICPSHDSRSPPPAAVMHSSPTPAPRSQPMFPSGRPLPRQKQRPVFSSTAPYPAPGRLPPLSRSSSHKMNERRPTALFPVTRASGRNVPHVRPVYSSTLSPTAPSLSVFQPRHAPRTSNDAPRLRTPQTVSEKRVCSDLTPGTSSVSTPGPSMSSSTASSSPATPPGSDDSDTAPCGFEDCDATLTQTSWEKHYDTVHGISEKTWVTDSLCLHPACRKAQAKAVVMATPRKQPKLTIGTWPTYKRHVKQMHFPKGRKYPCTFPGCTSALSRPDALLRHVENRHKVVHAGRERTGKRTSTERAADSEEGPARKKARVSTSPTKVGTPRAKPYAKRTLGVHEKKASLAPASSTASQKGKEVARGGDSKENRNPSFASEASTAGPSTIRIVDSEDVDMVDDEDEKMAQSEDEYDDEWPQGDIIEDEMNFDPDNYD